MKKIQSWGDISHHFASFSFIEMLPLLDMGQDWTCKNVQIENLSANAAWLNKMLCQYMDKSAVATTGLQQRENWP